jgi:predicted ester cyclase
MKPTVAPTETDRVAKRLVELCRAGKNHEAIAELYAENARHVEAMDPPPGVPYKRVTEGRSALLQKSEHFEKNVTVHSSSITDPMSNGDEFACQMTMDRTSKDGPMAGQRMQMSEYAVYTVKNGKITEGKFYYGGCG